MLTLALELSTTSGSLALSSNQRIVAEDSWDAAGRASQRVFEALRRMEPILGKSGFADLSRLVVGRGPGSYSGVRIAMSVARSLALPGHAEVFALSSWCGAASALARRMQAGSVCVVGDARRERFWMGMFDCTEGLAVLQSPFALVTAGDLAARVDAAGATLSADTTTADALAAQDLDSHRATPSARELLEETNRHVRAGNPSDELVPIYVHPPVFVKPRFAQRGQNAL